MNNTHPQPQIHGTEANKEHKNNKPNKSIVLSIFFTIFIDMLGIGIIIPVFPMLILRESPFCILPDGWSVQQGFIMLGWLSAVFPLAQFICAPILGQLADHYGRKKILALSISGTAISYILFGYGIVTQNLPLLFISRILDGATGGNISVAEAVIADISAPKDRAKNFGLIGMAFGLGFILGPALGGILTNHKIMPWFNPQIPFYFAAILGLINAYLILSKIPETLKQVSTKKINPLQCLSSFSLAFTERHLRRVMPSTFLSNAGFTFFTTFFGIILAHVYSFSSSGIGNYFAYIGIMIVVMQGFLIRRISGKVQDYKILRISLFGTGLTLAVYSIITPQNMFILYFIPPFMAMFNAMTNSFNSSLLARITPSSIKAQSFGVRSSVVAMSQAIPALLSGYIANLDPNLTIGVGSVTTICAGLVFWILFKPQMYHEKI